MLLRNKLAVVVALPAATLLLSSLWSRNFGVLPGEGFPPAPPNLNRGMPSCGNCHALTPGMGGVDTDVTLSARSLTPGQSISVTTTVTGGQTASPNGGFSSDVASGTFSTGPNTRLGLAGRGITHSDATAGVRTWTYGYTAPTAPGPLEMFVTANTVNGDIFPGPQDWWAFHGGDGTEQTPTPVRLFVNATRVTPVGDSCVGSWENHPVLGIQQPPDAGNANFAIELIGAAPLSPLVLLIGTPLPPIDLSFLGITGGCFLHVNSLATVVVGTGAGNAKFAEGTARIPLPLPNGLRASVRVQAAFLDAGNGRPLPMTVTNALDVAIQ
jgi:hypothetical protein